MPVTRDEIINAQTCTLTIDDENNELIEHAIQLVLMWEQSGHTFELYDKNNDFNIWIRNYRLHMFFGKYAIDTEIYKEENDDNYIIIIEWEHYEFSEVKYKECKNVEYYLRTNTIDYADIINKLIDVKEHYDKYHNTSKKNDI